MIGRPLSSASSGDDLLREALRGVDAGADRGAAERHLRDPADGGLDPLDAEANLARVARELLAEGDRGGVHQVGAARLHGVGPQHGLLIQRAGEVLQRRDEVPKQRAGDGDVHRRGEHVVGGLRCVHVIVRVHRAAERGGCEVGEHLVHVHVGGRAAAGLVDVDRELVAVLARDDAVGRRDDGVGDRRVDDAQLPIDDRGGALHARERDDLGGLETLARDREVLDSALRLRGVKGALRDTHLTHRVVLDPELCVTHGLQHPLLLAMIGCRFADVADDDIRNCHAFE